MMGAAIAGSHAADDVFALLAVVADPAKAKAALAALDKASKDLAAREAGVAAREVALVAGEKRLADETVGLDAARRELDQAQSEHGAKAAALQDDRAALEVRAEKQDAAANDRTKALNALLREQAQERRKLDAYQQALEKRAAELAEQESVNERRRVEIEGLDAAVAARRERLAKVLQEDAR